MADFHRKMRNGATLDFVFDWAANSNGDSTVTDWLASGETISTKTVTAESGITKDSDTLINTDTSVRVWLTSTTVGTYTITCEITTSASRTDERTLEVEVI